MESNKQINDMKSQKQLLAFHHTNQIKKSLFDTNVCHVDFSCHKRNHYDIFSK